MRKRYWLPAIILILAIIISAGIYFWTVRHAPSSSGAPAAQNATSTSKCSPTGATGGGGTIVALSGNHIVTHDSYENQTTTIIIGPYTNYYEPDLLTRVASSSLIVMGQAVSASGEGCDWNSNGFPATIDATTGFVSRIPTLPDIAAPAGWYAHRVETGAIVFTRQAEMSIPSGTEGFALGEQIDAGAYTLDHSPVAWAWMNVGTASGTIGASPASDWDTLGNYQTLRSAIGMGEENEMIYAVFDPTHYTVYEFTLYPYPNATDTPIFDAMVRNFGENL